MQLDATRQPAQQTRLGLDALGFTPTYSSPDLGLITRTSTPTRPKNSAAILKNMHFDGISWSAKGTGYTLHRDALFNLGASFKDFGIHNLADKTSRLVFQVGTKVYEYDPESDPMDLSEVRLFTAASETFPCIRSHSPQFMIYTNGVNEPQKWDGTTWAALGGFPVTIGTDAYTKPALCETFQGRLASAGFANLPYSVLLSTFGDPEDYDVTGDSPARAGVYTVPSELGPITSLKTTRINSTSNEEILLVGCKNGLVFITGSNADDFVRIVASDRFGIVNNRCWLKIDDSLLVLATDGIRLLSSNTAFSNLINTALTYHVQPIIASMNPGASEQPFVIDNPGRLECVFYFPRSGEITNRRGVVFNYSRLTSEQIAIISEKEYPQDSSSTPDHAPACGINYAGMQLCGGYGGKLQRHWSGNFFDDVGIDYRYLSPLLEPPSPAQQGSQRMIQIMTEGPSQNFTAKGWCYPMLSGDTLRRTLAFTKNLSSNRDGGTIIGSWQIGVHAFGGASYDIFSFYPKHAGRAWEMEISGNTSNGICNLVGIFATIIGGGTRQ